MFVNDEVGTNVLCISICTQHNDLGSWRLDIVVRRQVEGQSIVGKKSGDFAPGLNTHIPARLMPCSVRFTS